MALNCPLGPPQRVNTNSHIAYSIHPSIVYESTVFNLWVFAVLDFTPS